jgi:predicted transcriptional regulator
MPVNEKTFGGKRRDRTEVIFDILSAAQKGATLTRLIYRVNLNYNILEKAYLPFLLKQELLEEKNGNPNTHYWTTEKGKVFLHHYRMLCEMLPSTDMKAKVAYQRFISSH